MLVASFRLIDILFPDVHFFKSLFWDLRVTDLTERIYYSVVYVKNFWFWIKENEIPTSMAACALSCDSNYNCYIASFSSIRYYNFRYPIVSFSVYNYLAQRSILLKRSCNVFISAILYGFARYITRRISSFTISVLKYTLFTFVIRLIILLKKS